MKITTIGIDLAKTVFAVHSVNEHGRAVLKKILKRDQVLAFFANLSPCLICMEACGSAHYWSRKLQAMGHTVRLIAPHCQAILENEQERRGRRRGDLRSRRAAKYALCAGQEH
ncbi:transposase [Caballeronia arationis]|nr:transposase [Caballeronia arationis]